MSKPTPRPVPVLEPIDRERPIRAGYTQSAAGGRVRKPLRVEY